MLPEQSLNSLLQSDSYCLHNTERSLWHINSTRLEFILGAFWDLSEAFKTKKKSFVPKYKQAARQSHSQHAFDFHSFSHHLLLWHNTKLTGIQAHAWGTYRAWPQSVHMRGNHFNHKAALLPLGCEETTTQPFFKRLTGKSEETFSPRTLELRSMSPVGRRRTAHGSWDGTTALQHCRLHRGGGRGVRSLERQKQKQAENAKAHLGELVCVL